MLRAHSNAYSNVRATKYGKKKNMGMEKIVH